MVAYSNAILFRKIKGNGKTVNMDYSTFFDQKNDRHHTRSIKWDMHKELGKPEDAYPLWVADMDFKTMPEITEALKKVVESGIYGYTFSGESYYNALADWLKRRHHYVVERKWIYNTPGVVSAVNAVILTLTQENESVLIQEPVYHPFKKSILQNKRNAVVNPLLFKEDHYDVDFLDLEKQITDHDVKLFILCSPHNPVGKVFTEDELNRMVDICKKYEVIIVSDEIHMDFVYKGNKHSVLASLRKDYADHIITLYAASKTFNLAGMHLSQLITSNAEFLKKIKAVYASLGLHSTNTLGIIASETAYLHGDEYVDELVKYLSASVDWLNTFLKEELPQVKLVRPEGLYILWLDFRALQKSQEELDNFLLNQAHLWLNNGAMFGIGGEGFMRLNIALPREELKKVMNQLKDALK